MILSRRALGVVVVLSAIVLLSLVSHPHVVTYHASKFMNDHKPHNPPPDHYPDLEHMGGHHQEATPEPAGPNFPVVDKTFLLLKTGIEVAYIRLPAHFETTMKQFPNFQVYADSNDTIFGVPMVDSFAFLDEEILNHDSTKAYRVRRQSEVENWHWTSQKISGDSSGGWNLDRFKNVPAYAHAYVNHPGYDWYLMIDADSFMLPSTLHEVTKDFNPNDVLYFGKAVGSDPVFAHGGSGILLSKGALSAMFGNTQESLQATLKQSGEQAVVNCCGDSVTSFMYEWGTHHQSSDTLQYSEVGQWQGNPISLTRTVFDRWCEPVGTFHQLKPWEVDDLYKWSESKGKKRVLYADFYEDYIMPEIQNERRNWIVNLDKGSPDKTIFEGTQQEAHVKDVCRTACENDLFCVMWVFKGGEECVIVRDGISRGSAMNRFSESWKQEWTEVTTGYMIDRIRERRSQQPCDNVTDKQEGWRIKQDNEPGEFPLTSVTMEFGNSTQARSADNEGQSAHKEPSKQGSHKE